MFTSKIHAHYSIFHAIAKVDAFEELEDKLTQLSLLFGIKLALKDEKKPSSTKRLVDTINMLHGTEAVEELSKKSHYELRPMLKKYGIIEIKI